MRSSVACRSFVAALTVVVGVLTGLGSVAQAAARQLPAGASIPIRFETTVSSATSRPEEKVLATVREDVLSAGHVVIPRGSELRGHVLSAHPSGRVKGRASLAVAFNEVVIDGKPHRISARRIAVMAPAQHKRDAAIVGGGTAAGALVGALADGKGGAAKGALVGAGAGTGAVLVTKGKEVTLPAGGRWRVRLAQPLIVD